MSLSLYVFRSWNLEYSTSVFLLLNVRFMYFDIFAFERDVH